MRLTLAVSKKSADGLRAGGEFLFECVFHAESSLSCLNAPIILAFWRDGSTVEKEGCNFASLFFMLESHITSQYFVQQIVVLFQIIYTRQVEFLAFSPRPAQLVFSLCR